MRKDVVSAAAVEDEGVAVPVAVPVPGTCGRVVDASSELGSGVVGREWVPKFGRRSEVSDGEGGSGVGGRL